MSNLQILLKLSCYPFRIWCYKFQTFYVILMVTTRESPVVIAQKNTIKKSKHTNTKRHKNIHKKGQDKKQGTTYL